MAWFNKLLHFFTKYSISTINSNLSRDELLRRSRILIVDDEEPALINDLKAAHFAVDYVPDIDNSNLQLVEGAIYDLILLDFSNVGKQFGDDEGLDLLRHIKRVNPATIILSYTSKALTTDHADFYRQSDGVLSKDAGIQQSMERIEEALQKAHSIDNIWNGLLAVNNIRPDSDEDLRLQDLFVRSLTSKSKMNQLKNHLLTDGGSRLTEVLLEKSVELAVKSVMGL
ncbi:MAG: hypothetical protein WEB58_07550 [Planctomycetaceae bacterium]